jgi:hypothetical protein
MDRAQKQQLINDVTQYFKTRQWFNGAGFDGDIMVIAYNYYPALDIKFVKEASLHFGVNLELRDIRVVLPGSRKDDVPPYVR